MSRIEDEIKQSSFKNEYHKLIINLSFTSTWLENQQQQMLKPHGISIQQFNILRILRGQHPNPARVSLLQDRMVDRMSNASRLVEKLRKKELVERHICEKDRRAVDVLITDRGLKLLDSLAGMEKTWIEKLMCLSDKEAVQLNEMLDRIRG